MRWWAVLLLLAGCSTQAPLPASELGEPACPTLVNGTLDCHAELPALTILDQPPSLDEGWTCAIDHDDEGPREFFKLYTHADGRLGYHWRWPVAPWTHQFVALTLVEPDRTSWAIGPYQHEGFAQFPVRPAANEGEAHVSILSLRLDEQVDGEWRPLDARLDIAVVDDVGYFVWTWMEGTETVHFDIMDRHEERVWAPTSQVQEINGRMVSAAVDTAASGFAAQYWGPERAVSLDCTADGLPGGRL